MTSSAATRPCAPRVGRAHRPCGGSRSGGSSTTTCTPPTWPTGNCTRSGAGCRSRPLARRSRSRPWPRRTRRRPGWRPSGATSCRPPSTPPGTSGSASAPTSSTRWPASLRIKAYWDEAIAAQALALQASRDIADPGRIAQAALELCEVSQETGRHEQMLPLAEDSASIYRSQADRRGEAHALDQIGSGTRTHQPLPEALAYFHEARIRYRAAGDEHGVADTLSHSGITCWHLGRHPDATDHLGEALSLYRAAGDRRGEASTLNNLGRMQLLSGYHRDALDGLSKRAEDFRRDRRGAERGGRLSQHRLRLRLQGQLRGGPRCLPPGPGHFPRDRRPAQPGLCAQ